MIDYSKIERQKGNKNNSQTLLLTKASEIRSTVWKDAFNTANKAHTQMQRSQSAEDKAEPADFTFALCKNSLICRNMHIPSIPSSRMCGMQNSLKENLLNFDRHALSVGMQTPPTTHTHVQKYSHYFKSFEDDSTRIARGILTHSIRMESQSTG